MWDFFNTTAGGASILGVILALAGWASARHTNTLIATMDAHHQESLGKLGEVLRQMEANAGTRHGAVMDKLEGRG